MHPAGMSGIGPCCPHPPASRLAPQRRGYVQKKHLRLYLLVPEPLTLSLVPQFAGEGEKKAL